MILDNLNGYKAGRDENESIDAVRRLDAFAGYVAEYLALQGTGQDWKTIYFDGFAGSGARREMKKALYEELKFTPSEEIGYKGAAERVIALELGFDYYYFVDDHQSLVKLKEKLGALPETGRKRMIFRPEDCNGELDRLADAMRSDEFATLLFLDPVGFSIDWQSIARFSGTRTDLWLVIPTGTVVNRLLDAEGNLDGFSRLEVLTGLARDEMMNVLVHAEKSPGLFEEITVIEKIDRSLHRIVCLYQYQLSRKWKYVTGTPSVLRSGRNVPLCTFLCATDNKTVYDMAGMIVH
ncbi:MAG: three-Cys-motif partner protein TcmP [Chlorobiaceae bacterium]|nr:three-Cys-motif partner protein TcmP [Chlorobiaceae bacterium]